MPVNPEARDLCVNWPPERRKELPKILRTGICSLPNTPKRCAPKSTVHLADASGTVLLRFEVREIAKREGSKGVDLIARGRTIRKPRSHDYMKMTVNRNAPGAYVYLWPGSTQPDYEAAPGEGAGGTLEPEVSLLPSVPLLANNTAKCLRQPERRLVKAYTQWVGRPEIFSHKRLPEPGLYTDLFISATYTLVEAKAWTDRKTLRMAIGQLFDYQRYFPTRHPSLAILLPKKPIAGMMTLFDAKRIAVIWPSRGKSFADSVGGRLTSSLRL
jgi:hypothetical protein